MVDLPKIAPHLLKLQANILFRILEVHNSVSTIVGRISRFAQQLCGRHNALRQAKKATSGLNLLSHHGPNLEYT